MSKNAEEMQIAKIIHKQIGATAFAMLGAHAIGKMGKGLFFQIRGSEKVNYIHITLDYGSDTYNMEFGKIKGHSHEVISSYEGVYFDQLHDFIESETGLFTRL